MMCVCETGEEYSPSYELLPPPPHTHTLPPPHLSKGLLVSVVLPFLLRASVREGGAEDRHNGTDLLVDGQPIFTLVVLTTM